MLSQDGTLISASAAPHCGTFPGETGGGGGGQKREERGKDKPEPPKKKMAGCNPNIDVTHYANTPIAWNRTFDRPVSVADRFTVHPQSWYGCKDMKRQVNRY